MIRPARQDDRDPLRSLGHSDGDLDVILPRDRIGSSPRSITLIYEVPGAQPAGSASALVTPGIPELWLTGYVRVAAASRGRGIGTALVKAVVDAAASLGCARGYCTITPENTASIQAHLAAGYRPVGVAWSRMNADRDSPSGSESPRIVGAVPTWQVDQIRDIIDAAGVQRLVGLGSSRECPLGLLAPGFPGPWYRRLLDGVRRRPGSRVFLLQDDRDANLGMLVSDPAEQALILTRTALQELTPERRLAMAAVWRSAGGSAFAAMSPMVVHELPAVSPPAILENTHAYYAVEMGAPQA